MKERILSAKHVTKIYGVGTSHPVTALNDVNLDLDAGDFVCVMGPSGAGKSTFINCLSTIDLPTKGQVYINNQEIRTMSENEIGRFRYGNLGFIFQEFNLIDALTIRENIAVPLALANMPVKEIKERIEGIARRLEIIKLLDKYPGECSGGQRQRVAIARALVTHPKLIVADEPTGNLDSKNSHEILNIFGELNKHDGVAILMVTHDPMIASYADRMVYIKDGQIDALIERGDSTQKDFFHRIVDVNSAESLRLFDD